MKPAEYLIVDDGSAVDTVAIVLGLWQEFPASRRRAGLPLPPASRGDRAVICLSGNVCTSAADVFFCRSA
ncbi:MAG TPA: hypothetical protein VE175_13385, partial [Woeseiaceae bacterium]|nr:hypothetical protein [Woeseiaceae bacterium]